MGGIWAIARHTFFESLRTKFAIVTLALEILALSTFPFILTGDGTLAGRTRTYLAYSLSITTALLALCMIFLSTYVVASDVRKKMIFTVVTKPLSRWQYILGRWVGLVLLGTMLVAGCGAAIYAGASYLHSQTPINQKDRRIVETEIFTARQRVSPDPIDIEPFVRRRIERLQQSGQFAEVLEEFKGKVGGDEIKARDLMLREIRKQISVSLQSVRPGQILVRNFSGIHVAGSDIRSDGVVDARGEGNLQFSPEKRIRVMDMLVRVKASLIGRLIYKGPVRVNNVIGQVMQRRSESFVVRFFGGDANNPAIADVKKGDKVALTIEPVIQLSYKIKIAPGQGGAAGRVLKSIWQLQNPDPQRPSGYPLPARPQEDPVQMASTMTVPASVVDGRGKTRVLYQNANHPDFGVPKAISVQILNDDMSILFRRGGFDANFLRGLLLLLLLLAFLAALGVFTGSFLSFPVACLVCCAVLPFGFMGGFLSDAVSLPSHPNAPVDWSIWLGHYILRGMRVVLPDFSSTSPTDSLVDGMYISWSTVGQAALMTLAVRAMLLMLLAFWVFHKRELARVQV